MLGVQIGTEAGTVQGELNRLVSTISTGLASLHQLTDRSAAAAREASEEVQHMLSSSLSVLSEAEGHTRAITGFAEDAGYYLQFGDIVRQKLEHVHSALKDAIALHASAGSAAKPASQRAAVGQILVVQSAQLAQVKAEITAAGEKLNATFGGLAEKTECHGARHAEPGVEREVLQYPADPPWMRWPPASRNSANWSTTAPRCVSRQPRWRAAPAPPAPNSPSIWSRSAALTSRCISRR